MENIIITDNEEMVTCRICGINKKRIYGAHLKNEHKITSDEYKSMFPGAPLMATSDLKNTTINSGKHMKEEKYKTMFSEKFKGENNPNHKNKTTEEERKSRSPFSKNFSKYEEIENKEEHISNFVKEAIKDRISPNQKEYYMVKGYSEEESIKMVSERQKTFSLDKCIEKYGEEKGYKRWLDRQEKWLTSYQRINYSAISQELFIELYKKLRENKIKNKIYFAKLNNGEIHETNKNYEFRLKLNESYILPDFYIPDFKLILEFDGTYYHRNTTENKEREDKRNKGIENMGIEVIHIAESDYIKNKELTISKLVDLILKKKNK